MRAWASKSIQSNPLGYTWVYFDTGSPRDKVQTNVITLGKEGRFSPNETDQRPKPDSVPKGPAAYNLGKEIGSKAH